MTRPTKEFGFSGSKRNARYLMAWATCFLLATGPALGGPAASDTNGAVASVSQQSLPSSVRAKLWLSLTNAIDQSKFERIWQCMQFLGAPVDFAEAINICAPCRRGQSWGRGPHRSGKKLHQPEEKQRRRPECSKCRRRQI